MTDFFTLRVGKVGSPYDPTKRASLDNNVAGVYMYPTVQGVKLAPSQFFTVVPLVIVANNIAASQTPSGASSLTLTAGTGVTSAVVKGVSCLAFDCARCVTITGVGGTVQRNYTITGYDDYQQLMTCTFAGPSGATTATSLKALRYVSSITVDGGTTAAITVGTSDTIGLPYRVDAYEYCDIAYNGSDVTASTGFTIADSTSPATASTGDVRGTYALPSASDGIKRLGVDIQLVNVDTVDRVWGVAQV